jgi:hypothetical protein
VNNLTGANAMDAQLRFDYTKEDAKVLTEALKQAMEAIPRHRWDRIDWLNYNDDSVD